MPTLAPTLLGEAEAREQLIADSRSAFRDALVRVLAELAVQGDATRLEALARRLVEQAEAGDRDALRDVLDRIDGRPSVADPERGPRKVTFSWGGLPDD